MAVSIMKVGNKLVQSFGRGEGRKIFITTADNYGNHTITVFDRNGKQIMERFKSIGEREKVGDRFVKTITKETAIPKYGVKKSVTENLYASSGSKLGKRETVWLPDDDMTCRTEYRYFGNRYVAKTDYDGWVRRARYIPENNTLIYYNDRGTLPEHISK